MTGPLILTGMHRSGTSFLARLFQKAGLFLGENLMEAAPSNPLGHFEDLDVARFHAAIIRRYGWEMWAVYEPILPRLETSEREWLRTFVARRAKGPQPWGFKDPRVCFFLPDWKEVAAGMKAIAIFRDYGEVVASLQRRHAELLFTGSGPRRAFNAQFWKLPDAGLRMWLAHNQALLRFVEAEPATSIVVQLARVRAGYPIVSVVRERWDAALEDVPVQDALEPSLIRSGRAVLPVADGHVMRAVTDTWTRLQRRAGELPDGEQRVPEPTRMEVVGTREWHRRMKRDLKRRREEFVASAGRPVRGGGPTGAAILRTLKRRRAAIVKRLRDRGGREPG